MFFWSGFQKEFKELFAGDLPCKKLQVMESEKSQEQVIKCNIVGEINELEICCVSLERWTIYPLLKVSVLYFCKEIFFFLY